MTTRTKLQSQFDTSSLVVLQKLVREVLDHIISLAKEAGVRAELLLPAEILNCFFIVKFGLVEHVIQRAGPRLCSEPCR
jgi:hypothetical protein